MTLAAGDLLAGVKRHVLAGGALTDWLSTTPALGLAWRPVRERSLLDGSTNNDARPGIANSQSNSIEHPTSRVC